MDTTRIYASPFLDNALPPFMHLLSGPYLLHLAGAGVDEDVDGDDDEWEEGDEEWEEDDESEDSDVDLEDDWDDDDELDLESRFLTNIKGSSRSPLPKRPIEGPAPKKAKKPGRARPPSRVRDAPPDTDDD